MIQVNEKKWEETMLKMSNFIKGFKSASAKELIITYENSIKKATNDQDIEFKLLCDTGLYHCIYDFSSDLIEHILNKIKLSYYHLNYFLYDSYDIKNPKDKIFKSFFYSDLTGAILPHFIDNNIFPTKEDIIYMLENNLAVDQEILIRLGIEDDDMDIAIARLYDWSTTIQDLPNAKLTEKQKVKFKEALCKSRKGTSINDFKLAKKKYDIKYDLPFLKMLLECKPVSVSIAVISTYFVDEENIVPDLECMTLLLCFVKKDKHSAHIKEIVLNNAQDNKKVKKAIKVKK